MAATQSEITALLHDASHGDADAMERLLPIVYDELRRMAANHLRGERPDHTLGPTALVHEAYLKLVIPDVVNWEGRSHFFAIAARSMRHILVDHARRRTAAKRGRQHQVTLDPDVTPVSAALPDDVLDIDRALEKLTLIDPRQAQLVELRYFVGLSIEETARVQGTSSATVKRDWILARAWLERELSVSA